MFKNGTNCTKNLRISNKSSTFAEVFMNKLRSDALRSDCVGCFIVYLAKNIVYFTKNQLFFEKKVEKICTYQKNVVPLHRQTTKTFTTMKKKTIFRTAWAVVSLALIALVCYWWHKQGCGVWSLVAAISFYGILSAGLMIAVDDMIKEQ